MADSTTIIEYEVQVPAGRLSPIRLAVTGAIVSSVFFALCWAGAFLPIGPATHAYLGLFTDAEITSGLALVQGIGWSFIFGALIGALIAIVYNMLDALDRR